MAPEDLEQKPLVESRHERSLAWIGDRRANLIAYHVVVLDTIELPFKFPYFSAICIHLLTGAGSIFVELVDDQRGVPIYHEAFDAELNGYTESVETCFVFGGIVGDQKIYPKNISKLILGRRDEQNARTSTIDVESIIEVHHLGLRASSGDGLLNPGPLSDEINECPRLDGRPASEFDGVSAELNSPLDDAAIGFFIVENVP